MDAKESLVIMNDIDNMLKTIKHALPDSKIILSSLLPRKENDLLEKYNEINKYLLTVTLNDNNILLMDNKQVKQHLLVDNKHLNKSGFFIFLANIRFILFGILPVVKKPYEKRYQRFNNHRH